MNDAQQLLAEYAESGSETAFRELVSRYVDFVYSAALRLLNGDAHLAEDVTQTVFADLARSGRTLSPDVMLGGWLHRHTCFVASKILRGERRRRERERQASEMNMTEDHSAANLAQIGPVLDEAINELSPEDRAAILLRFFEQKDFQAVGAALGGSEEAARKRVDRALDKLHGLLSRRGVALSATALAATLATQVVSAAPVGLAVSISSAALASAAVGGTTLTFLQIMSMTKLKVGIISAAVIVAVAIPVAMQLNTKSKLNETTLALQLERERSREAAEKLMTLAKQVGGQLNAEAAAPHDDAELARLRRDLAKARGDLAQLRRDNTTTNTPSALSGLRANPEMWKAIREQQKMGLSMVYGDLAKRLKLNDEQGTALNEVLTDVVMDNIDHITAILADKKSPEEANQVFTAQEAAMNEKVRALLGDEAYTQFQDYTKNLASHITAEQFKGMMTGDKAEKDAKAKEFYALMQQETTTALANAGLPSDYQLVPTFNFRNFVSESVAEGNLKLLDGIYGNVATKSGNLLNPAELKKFEEFRAAAIKNNRMGLAMNRQLMSPGAK